MADFYFACGDYECRRRANSGARSDLPCRAFSDNSELLIALGAAAAAAAVRLNNLRVEPGRARGIGSEGAIVIGSTSGRIYS